MRTLTITVRAPVTLEVSADDFDGEVTVTSVKRVVCLPSTVEVMEAIDADDQFGELDELFGAAKGEEA